MDCNESSCMETGVDKRTSRNELPFTSLNCKKISFFQHILCCRRCIGFPVQSVLTRCGHLFVFTIYMRNFSLVIGGQSAGFKPNTYKLRS